jgi:hypothetical protein
MAMIELHAFMWLADLFKERGWTLPHYIQIEEEIGVIQLLDILDIPLQKVEVVFINHKAYSLEQALIKPGDRVALVPPGVPGPHRFLLGFKNR